MIIALDYDDTFTADVNFWTKFIAAAQAAGYVAICATSRFDSDGNRRELRAVLPQSVPIVFCNHNYKREMCAKAGYRVDVWVDDTPESIGEMTLETMPA